MFLRGIFISIAVFVVHGGRFDHCSIGEYSKILNLNNLENNAAKNEEIVRTKAFFTQMDSFTIWNRKKKVFFGRRLNNHTVFDISFEKDGDNESTNCALRNISSFNDEYTEVDFILKKNGRFVVIIYGKSDEVFECQTGVVFGGKRQDQFKILIRGIGTYFVDCPCD
ncbi:hypothetical protein ACFFRR_010957 [Megaselia abdita]